MNKIALAIVLILLISSVIVAGILLSDLGKDDVSDNKLFTYPLSVEQETFIVSLETNWNAEPAPKVTLINSTGPTQYAIELYFHGGTEKTITYNITIPTDLLGGDISLIRKYYLQDPDSYTLSNNSTHNSLQMTFDYNPYFSGSGYFVIKGTEGVIA
jgi:hypothetical protein